MSKAATASLTVLAGGALLALGLSVGAFASSSGSSGALAGTTSETTEKATTTKYRAAALTARAEVPKPTGVGSTARGSFSLTLTSKGSSYSVTWTLTYRGLTGSAAAAHIHRGKPGKAGPVILALCQPCRTGRTGKAAVSKAVVSAMQAGSAYVNVHTARNKAGEIRGQLKKV